MEKPRLLVDAKMGGCIANPAAAGSVLVAQGGYWAVVCGYAMVGVL